MHELSVTEGLIRIVSDEVTKRQLPRVLTINLVVGELTSIVDESVQFYFDIMSKGTPLDGAVLVFRKIEPEFACTACGHRFRGRSVGSLCPGCGGRSVVAEKGQEFYIESIEVEDGAD